MTSRFSFKNEIVLEGTRTLFISTVESNFKLNDEINLNFEQADL